MNAASLGFARLISDAPTRRGRPHEVLLVPSRTFWTILYWSCIAAFALIPLYAKYSLLIGPGLALTIFIGWHLVAVGRRLPWLPGLMALLAGIQWVVSSWVAYIVDQRAGFGGMVVPPSQYFLFAVPSLFAYVIGLYLPFFVSKRVPHSYEFRAQAPDNRLSYICTLMVIVGTLAKLFIVPRAPHVVRFAVTFMATLALVGTLGLILLRARGWRWWTLTALLPVAYTNARDAQFLEVLMWALFIGIFATYRRRVGSAKHILLGVGAILLLHVVNASKRDYREDIWTGRVEYEQRTSAASKSFIEHLTSPRELFSIENVAYSVSRLNEGWITSRLLAWTPANEPFAKGETVWRAIEASILPRFLAPDKVQAGGRSTVPRFSGIILRGETSMNLSVPGEMYANWGLTGAWFGTFVVAFLLGYTFLGFAVRARRSVFWFAWAPFLFMGAISPEMGLVEVFNTIAKASVVMATLVAVFPSWRRVLWPRRLPARAQAPLAARYDVIPRD